MADLEGDTHGDFEDLLVALVTPPDVYDCQEVIRAIKVRLAVGWSSDSVQSVISPVVFAAGSGCWDD